MKRSGFTLVELLVVLGLMITLAAIAVTFVPRLAERQNTWRGSDRVSGWLAISRQWAKRDARPTGVRFAVAQPTLANPSPDWVTDLQYVQQPPDYTVPNSLLFAVPPYPASPLPQSITVLGPSVDFFGGQPGNPALWVVQPGDYIEIQGGGQIHLVTGLVPSGSPPTCNTVQLATVPAGLTTQGSSSGGISQYRFIRSPRIVSGEQSLQLPQDVGIDLACSRLPNAFNPYPGAAQYPSPTAPLNILFSPAGPVTGSAAAVDKIILLVRDVTKVGFQADSVILVTVNCRTGMVATQPVDMSTSTLSQTNLAVPPGGPALTAANNTLPPIALASVGPFPTGYSINPGTYVLLDPTGSQPEVQKVLAVKGNSVQLGQVNYSHQAPFTVVISPYTFALSPQTSGM